MEKKKYEKYVFLETKPPPIHPRIKGQRSMNVINVDDGEPLKEAPYMECNLVWQKPAGEQGSKPHNHDFDEYMLFLGTNPEDPMDLGAEVEFWLGGEEKYVITKSCAVFIPKGLYHCPIFFHRVDKPFYWITTAPEVNYSITSLSPDPKWANFKNPPVWPAKAKKR